MLNCIYHPTQAMRVVEDEEYQDLLSTGVWFAHPNDAKAMREKHERQILKEQRLHDKGRKRGPNHQQSSKDGGVSTQPVE